jgi:uncharacterized protein (TIGR02646 family)
MRNVLRGDKPASLRRNAATWKRLLLEEIRACKRQGKKPTLKLLRKYNQPDVRDGLRAMYRGLCCYCEALIGDVSFDHIEHRRPKKRFPQDAFRWENLHLACQLCNNAKGNSWDRVAPILDAVDDLITDHLSYAESGLPGLLRWPITPRGKTTVEQADLNRNRLPFARLMVYMEALRAIKAIKTAPLAPTVNVVKQELQARSMDEYGTVIAYAIKEWCP